MIKKSKDIEKELNYLINHGNPKGNLTGFKSFDEYYSIKYGAFTIILAEPHNGKSELGFEICINQAIKFGKKSLVYSPETGTVADIYAELIYKYLGKPIQRSLPYSATDKEYYRALAWVDEYFSIIDSDEKAYSYQEIMSLCTNEDLIFVDPNNEVVHDFQGAYQGRQDIYIEDIMAQIRRFCKKKDKHMIITMHPASQQAIFDPETKKSYYGMPRSRMAAGGQAWFRKAMGWINMWRPPTFINDSDGMPYPENIVIVEIEKAKPKGIGKKGTFPLYFDFKRNRYYEYNGDGNEQYAFDHEKNVSYAAPNAIQPNFDFEYSVSEQGDIINTEIDLEDSPF